MEIIAIMPFSTNDGEAEEGWGNGCCPVFWVVESETHRWNVRPRRGVLEHAAMAGGKDEAVAVEPIWVLGVVPHDLVVQDVTHRSAPHGQTRSVTRVSLLHGIHPQESDHVHGLLHQGGIGGLVHGGGLGNRGLYLAAEPSRSAAAVEELG